MANIERMTVVFPEPLAAELRAAVEAGEYASTSEAVCDAVQLWSGQRQLETREIDRLRGAWDAGKASPTHGSIDFGDLRQEARERLAAARTELGNAD